MKTRSRFPTFHSQFYISTLSFIESFGKSMQLISIKKKKKERNKALPTLSQRDERVNFFKTLFVLHNESASVKRGSRGCRQNFRSICMLNDQNSSSSLILSAENAALHIQRRYFERDKITRYSSEATSL